MDRPPAVTRNEHVVGDTNEDFPIHPHRVVVAVAIEAVLNSAIKRNQAGFVRAGDLPRAALRQPVVWLLALITVVDFLFEQAVLVVDPISVTRHAESGQGIQKARGQSAQPTVAQGSVWLTVFYFIQICAQIVQGSPTCLSNPEVTKVVPERLSDQEFDRQIIQSLWILW